MANSLIFFPWESSKVIWPSLLAIAIILPWKLMLTLVLSVLAWFKLFSCQILAVSSLDPVTTCFPSWLNTAVKTDSWCPLRVVISSPCIPQILALPSLDAVIKNWPSGLKLTLLTKSWCPRKVAIKFPCKSQILAVLSAAAPAIFWPSGLKLTL